MSMMSSCIEKRVETASLMLSDDEEAGAKKSGRVGGARTDAGSSACVSTVTPHSPGADWGGGALTPSLSELKRNRMDFAGAGDADYSLAGLGWAASTDSECGDEDSPWQPNERKRGVSGSTNTGRDRKRRRQEEDDDSLSESNYRASQQPAPASDADVFDSCYKGEVMYRNGDAAVKQSSVSMSPSASTSVPSSSKPPSSQPGLTQPSKEDLSTKVNLLALSQQHIHQLMPPAYMKKPPSFLSAYSLPPHQLPPDLYTSLSMGASSAAASGAPTSKCMSSHLLNGSAGSAESNDPTSAQEALPIYQSAAQAPGRLPAHKPVRLNQPKHPLAPPGTPVYFKYGEEHYPEETIPEVFTYTESDGTICRYITNFLVYNKRGERLLPIEVLDQPRHGALVLYGSLLPSESMGLNASASTDSSGRSAMRQNGRSRSDKRRGSTKRRNDDDCSSHPPYPVRVELSEWCIDYGQEPQNVPFIWLISRWDVYYRLEKPAGRYIPTFASAKLKFEVSTRVIKCLQYRPDYSYKEIVELLTASSRQERNKRRLEELRRRRHEKRASALSKRKQHTVDGGDCNDNSDDDFNAGRLYPLSRRSNDMSCGLGGGLLDDESYNCNKGKKTSRPNWKVTHSLSTPEGTGIKIEMPEGREQPRTPWGAPFAVEGVTPSTLLGLTDFLESQMRNFLEGVGGDCPNLLETPLMQALRDKASLRRETIQLVEAKKRTLENMATANGYPHLAAAAAAQASSQFDLPAAGQPPPAITLHVGVSPVRHHLPNTVQIATGATMPGPLVTFGFALNDVHPKKSAYDPSGGIPSGKDAGATSTPPLTMAPLLAPHHPALVMLKTRHQEEQELGQLLQVLREFSDPEFDGYMDADEDSEDDESGDDDLDRHLKPDDASSAASDLTAQRH